MEEDRAKLVQAGTGQFGDPINSASDDKKANTANYLTFENLECRRLLSAADVRELILIHGDNAGVVVINEWDRRADRVNTTSSFAVTWGGVQEFRFEIFAGVIESDESNNVAHPPLTLGHGFDLVDVSSSERVFDDATAEHRKLQELGRRIVNVFEDSSKQLRYTSVSIDKAIEKVHELAAAYDRATGTQDD